MGYRRGMQLRRVSIGLGLLWLGLVTGCGSKSKSTTRDATIASPPRPVAVHVNTDLKNPPRLTLGPGVSVPPRPATQQVGTLRIRAELCRMEPTAILSDTAERPLLGVEVVGNKLYALDHNHVLLRFDILPGNKCRLKLDPTWAQGGRYRSKLKLAKLSRGADTLVASSYLGSVVVRGGRVAYTCKARDQGQVALHPSGKWGLAGFSSSDVQRIEYGPRACKGAPWYLTNLKDDTRRRGPFRMVGAIGFLGESVLVGGVLAIKVAGWRRSVVVGFDAQGRRRFQAGALTGPKPQSLRFVQDIHACGKGRFCVLDHLAHRLTLWNPTGQFEGAVALAPLFGQPSPALWSFTVDAQGVAYVTSARRRAGPTPAKPQSLNEGLLFRVQGLAGKTP